jgi:hypothetical protein
VLDLPGVVIFQGLTAIRGTCGLAWQTPNHVQKGQMLSLPAFQTEVAESAFTSNCNCLPPFFPTVGQQADQGGG